MRLEERAFSEEDPCPVPDATLGELYRANPQGLNQLIEMVPPAARAWLAMYCYRRGHLASIGLAIASTCDKDDLVECGSNAGAFLFERSRNTQQSSAPEPHTPGRRKITLATESPRSMSPMDDEDDQSEG